MNYRKKFFDISHSYEPVNKQIGLIYVRNGVTSLYTFHPIPQDLTSIDWQTEFIAPATTRKGFSNNNDTLTYSQIAGIILGVPSDEFSYKEWLYEVIYTDNSKVHLLSGQLDKQIDNQIFQGIQKLFNIHNEQKGLSANRFVAFMQGNNLLPLKEYPNYYRYLTLKFIDVINLFAQNHGDLLHADFRRVIVDCIKWGFNYLDKWLRLATSIEDIPKVIWYGTPSKSEIYFLLLLYLMGIDLLIVNSDKQNPFDEIQGIKISTFYYPNRCPIEPFPKEKPTRKSTIARKATTEINNIINADGTLLLKPFQLRDYLPKSITLQTTYDEIHIIGKERAFVRPNFTIEKNSVDIPVIFAKVLGISTDRNQYWQNFYQLKENNSLVTIYQKLPLKPEVKGNQQFHYQFASTANGLDPKKIIQSNWWQHKEISKGMQLALAHAIKRYVEKTHFLPQTNETQEDVKRYLFSQAMNVPTEIMKLIQQYDYAQEVPKILIYTNGTTENLTRSDAALLLLLNELGFDIVIYNPTGQNDLELYIPDEKFDSHWLEEISFEEPFQADTLALKGTSALKSLFNKWKK